MAPESRGESSKHAIGRSGHNTLIEATMQASGVVISLVQEAAALAPCAELKQAAAVALIIFETIQAVKDNKEAYKRLGDDSAGLIVAIWRSFKKAESPKEWLSADMQEILVELTHTLDHICSFVQEKLARNKAMRLIYSRADIGKIAEYRENLNSAMQRFELQSHMNIDLKLGKLSKQIRYRNGEHTKSILEYTTREAGDLEEEAERIHEPKVVKKTSTHLRQLEIDHQAEDEREQYEELKKREKVKDRQLELERLRAAVRAVEMENRLKKAEEEEMLELRRKIADGRRPQAQPSKNKKISTQEDDVEDDEDWRRKEEEELWRMKPSFMNPRRSPNGPQVQPSKKKRNSTREDGVDDKEDWRRKEEEEIGRMKTSFTNPRRSPKGPHGASETVTDDEEPPRRSKMRTTHRKLSPTPPHLEETEEQPMDEEKSPPPKKTPKVARKPQIPPGSPPLEVDDLMAQFQGFGTGVPLGGNPHGSRPSTPMYHLPYGSPFPPPMGPDGYGYGYGYGYGGGVPGSVVNSGNIIHSTITNVGNDNSVRKIYRAPRKHRT